MAKIAAEYRGHGDCLSGDLDTLPLSLFLLQIIIISNVEKESTGSDPPRSATRRRSGHSHHDRLFSCHRKCSNRTFRREPLRGNLSRQLSKEKRFFSRTSSRRHARDDARFAPCYSRRIHKTTFGTGRRDTLLAKTAIQIVYRCHQFKLLASPFPGQRQHDIL